MTSLNQIRMACGRYGPISPGRLHPYWPSGAMDSKLPKPLPASEPPVKKPLPEVSAADQLAFYGIEEVPPPNKLLYMAARLGLDITKGLCLGSLVCFAIVIFSMLGRDISDMLDSLTEKSWEITTSFKGKENAFSKESLQEREKLFASLDQSAKFADAISRHNEKLSRYVLPAVTAIKTKSYYSGTASSGFIYNNSGVIITCDHCIVTNGVVDSDIEVTLYNGKKYKAQVIARDPDHDLAALKINPDSALPTLSLADAEPKTGTVAMVFGNPGNSKESSIPATVIYNKRTALEDGIPRTFIQTSDSAVGGISGGPLVSMRGKVLGVRQRGGNYSSLSSSLHELHSFISKIN